MNTSVRVVEFYVEDRKEWCKDNNLYYPTINKNWRKNKPYKGYFGVKQCQ